MPLERKVKQGDNQGGYKVIGSAPIVEPNKNPNDQLNRKWLCQCNNCKYQKIISEHHLLHRPRTSKYCTKCSPRLSGTKHYNWKGYGEISSAYWFGVVKGAKDRNIEFNLTIEEAWEIFEKQEGKCVFTGKKLKHQRHGVNNSKNASIDRIDSSKGYSKDNIQWTEARINIMKKQYSNQEFLEIIKEIQAYTK